MMSEAKFERTLKDITEAIVDCEHKTAPTQNFGIPLIRTTDIKNGRLALNSANRVSEEIYRIWSNRIEPRAGDIVLAREAPVGEVGIVPKNERVCLGQRIVLIRIDKEKADPRYILYLLCSPKMKHDMTARAEGSVVPHLNMQDIRILPIPELPELSEQERAAKILGSLDDKIELNAKMCYTLERISHALFKHWFIDFEFPNEEGRPYKSSCGEMVYNEKFGKEIPAVWKVDSIGSVLTTKSGGTPSRTTDSYWKNGTIGWINSGKVKDFRIVEPVEFVTEEARDNSSTKLIPKHTTVIAITGATLGEVSFLEIDSCISQNVVAILGTSDVSSEFIYFWITHTINDLMLWQTGGAQQHINKKIVDDSLLLIPDKQIMEKYAIVAKPIFEKIGSNCFEAMNLMKIRDSLLPKLMSGRIRVPVGAR